MGRNPPCVGLVICDIDGTIVLKDEEPPRDFARAVDGLKKRNIPFTFASGRLPGGISPYMKLLGVDYPAAACNGAIIWQGENIIKRHTLAPAPLAPLAAEAVRMGMTVLYAINGVEYCLDETAHTMARRGEKKNYPPVRPLNESEWNGALLDKMNIIDDEERCPLLERFVAPLKKTCAVTRYGNYGFEIVAPGVSKASGMREIASLIGVPLKNVMAIGDSENDNLMLAGAGWAAVVANGEERTMGFADYVCFNKAGLGAAEAITRFCL